MVIKGSFTLKCSISKWCSCDWIDAHSWRCFIFLYELIWCVLNESNDCIKLSEFFFLPLRPATSGTPAAAAGSRSLGRRRSEQPWRRTDTPPSRNEWRSSGRPPPWWCCGKLQPGCSRDGTGVTAGVKTRAGWICWGLHLPVNQTGSAVQTAVVDEANAFFEMLQTAEEIHPESIRTQTNCSLISWLLNTLKYWMSECECMRPTVLRNCTASLSQKWKRFSVAALNWSRTSK